MNGRKDVREAGEKDGERVIQERVTLRDNETEIERR